MGRHDDYRKEFRNVFVKDSKQSLSMSSIPLQPLFLKLRPPLDDAFESFSKETNFYDEGDPCELDNSIAVKNGSIRNSSPEGASTTLKITLPLLLSPYAGMTVIPGGHSCVIRFSQISDTVELRKYQVEKVNGQSRVINLRGEQMPVFDP